MSDLFIKSKDIKIFPTAYRNGYDPGSKWYNEENISKISARPNGMTPPLPLRKNNNGFVIGKRPNELLDDGDELKFNLAGYWFTIKFDYNWIWNAMEDTSVKNILSAYIKIEDKVTEQDPNNTLLHAKCLVNLKNTEDDNLDCAGEQSGDPDVFGGVKFNVRYGNQSILASNYDYILDIAYFNPEEDLWYILPSAVESVDISVENNLIYNYYVNGSGKMCVTWWIDQKGNFYKCGIDPIIINNSINELPLIYGDFKNAIITQLAVNDYEVDWADGTGGRKYYTASAISDLGHGLTDGRAYKKINAIYDHDGTLHLSWCEER